MLGLLHEWIRREGASFVQGTQDLYQALDVCAGDHGILDELHGEVLGIAFVSWRAQWCGMTRENAELAYVEAHSQ